MLKLLRILSGLGLVLLGILGLILPIMPGWVFLIPGLVILADHFPPVRRLLHWAKGKFEQQTGRMRDNNKTPQ
ncbi:PGPGW domain-containing protein [uncultured Paludibaculum sp.]|uniref:PGPGW domain-containing protein n=1 Tax=uncultured Paludibaculum sp. TaxID=1765020 RepID=UPI002AAA9842|nr:PGPGW domain-containing protein [uncultured Paludibaculum sp.]